MGRSPAPDGTADTVPAVLAGLDRPVSAGGAGVDADEEPDPQAATSKDSKDSAAARVAPASAPGLIRPCRGERT